MCAYDFGPLPSRSKKTLKDFIFWAFTYEGFFFVGKHITLVKSRAAKIAFFVSLKIFW